MAGCIDLGSVSRKLPSTTISSILVVIEIKFRLSIIRVHPTLKKIVLTNQHFHGKKKCFRFQEVAKY